MFVEDRDHRLLVGDVGFDKADMRVAQNIVDVRQISGVCQLINDDDPGVGARQDMAREVRAYEPGAARNDHCVNQARISSEKMYCRLSNLRRASQLSRLIAAKVFNNQASAGWTTYGTWRVAIFILSGRRNAT